MNKAKATRPNSSRIKAINSANLLHTIKYKENKSKLISNSSSKKIDRSSWVSASKNKRGLIEKNKSLKYSSSSKSATKM
jgi:hypothetical protein